MQDFFIGRQPIYTQNLKIVGYELLYRSGMDNDASFTDGDLATADVLVSSHMDFGLDKLVGQCPAFINLTRSFLTGDHPLPLPSDQLVLEVLEDIALDPFVLDGLHRLAAEGYTIALDDFELREDTEPALEIASIVKVDVLSYSPADLTRQVAGLKRYKVRLLAEKVETHEMFARCIDLGFEYFQGYFFCKPNVIKGHRRPSNLTVLLQLIGALNNPDVTLEQVEKLVARDAPLVLRLLRYINSAGVGLRQEVSSLRQALLQVGTKRLRNWISLVLLTNVEHKPEELVRTGLVRARMCELMARELDLGDKDQFFFVGLLSVLDALLDCAMEELLEQFSMGDEIKSALLVHEGPLGTVLKQVLAYERGAWTQLDTSAIAPEAYRLCYLKATQWADNNVRSLTAASV